MKRLSARWRVNGQEGQYGDQQTVYSLASVTKPLFAQSVLVAVEEGSLGLDEVLDKSAIGYDTQYQITPRQLLSHSSGIPPAKSGDQGRPGIKRVYSNYAYELLGRALEAKTEFSPDDYLAAAVLEPLSMTETKLGGSPAHGATSNINDLVKFSEEILSPSLIAPVTSADACRAQYPQIAGVLPGYGSMSPNPWGLGLEIRGNKAPHWTGPDFPADTVGHFGQAGTFFWLHRKSQSYCVVLTNRDFGPWAIPLWSQFNASLTPSN